MSGKSFPLILSSSIASMYLIYTILNAIFILPVAGALITSSIGTYLINIILLAIIVGLNWFAFIKTSPVLSLVCFCAYLILIILELPYSMMLLIVSLLCLVGFISINSNLNKIETKKLIEQKQQIDVDSDRRERWLSFRENVTHPYPEHKQKLISAIMNSLQEDDKDKKERKAKEAEEVALAIEPRVFAPEDFALAVPDISPIMESVKESTANTSTQQRKILKFIPKQKSKPQPSVSKKPASDIQKELEKQPIAEATEALKAPEASNEQKINIEQDDLGLQSPVNQPDTQNEQANLQDAENEMTPEEVILDQTPPAETIDLDNLGNPEDDLMEASDEAKEAAAALANQNQED